MSRYQLIVLLFFLFSGLNAQKQDSLKVPGRTIQKQDSLKVPGKSIKEQDTAFVVTKINQKSSVIKGEEKKQQIPDSVRFSPKVPPALARVNKIDIVTKLQGVIKPFGKDKRETVYHILVVLNHFIRFHYGSNSNLLNYAIR